MRENTTKGADLKQNPLDDFLTVEEVCQRLGVVSASPVMNRVYNGTFHPVKGLRTGQKGKKRLLFNSLEIEAEIERIESLRRLKPGNSHVNREQRANANLKPSKSPSSEAPAPETQKPATPPKTVAARNGTSCAQAVRLFREGKTQLDVIIEMEVDFDTARYFEESFHAAQPGWYLPNKQFVLVRNLLKWTETPPTPDGFMRAFRRFIDKEIARAVGERTNDSGSDLTEEERKQLARLGDNPTPDDDEDEDEDTD